MGFTLTLSNGLQMPAFGLGTYHNRPGTSGEVGEAVRQALDLGYRHIDCASVYNNEDEIGKSLSDYFATGKVSRGDVFITSKLWNTEHRPELVRAACKKTLDDLQLSYLDLYLMHWPVAFPSGQGAFPEGKDGKILIDSVSIVDTWKEMEKLVEEGLVRSIGVSNFTMRELRELLSIAKIRPAVNQIELHPYLPQKEMLEFCRKEHIILTAYSPFGSGRAPSLFDDEVIKSTAQKHGATPAQILVSWALERGTSVIPKSVKAERLAENMKHVSLTAEEVSAIGQREIQHRYIDPDWSPLLFKEEI